MKKIFTFISALIFGTSIFAQDDLYDAPEPAVERTYANSAPSQNYQDPNQPIDEYNPNFDYRYSRSLRRMYDPYYVMPGSAYMNMYSYPQFSSYYSPYSSGFSMSFGSGWGDPYYSSWNNPYSYNSWYDPYNSWNNGWGYNNFNYGYSNWGMSGYGCNRWSSNYYSPYYSYNSFYSPYYSNWNNGWGYNNYNYGRGNNGGWNNNHRPRNNYTNVDNQPAHSNIDPPRQRRMPRPMAGSQDANSTYGNTTYRPAPNINQNTNSSWGNSPSRNGNTPSTPANNNNSNNSNNNNNSSNTGSKPSRMGSGGGSNSGRF